MRRNRSQPGFSTKVLLTCKQKIMALPSTENASLKRTITMLAFLNYLVQSTYASAFLSTTTAVTAVHRCKLKFVPAELNLVTFLPRTVIRDKRNSDQGTSFESSPNGRGDNKAMQFLRKVGKIGSVANKQFVNAVGVDEGPVGKSTSAKSASVLVKSKLAFLSCAVSGIIDDLSESFPFTSSGTQWAGITDRVMGGMSNGTLSREKVEGRMANVLRGKVSLMNNGGFIQMASDLSHDPEISPTVDVTKFDGVELDLLVNDKGRAPKQQFNIHLRSPACLRQFSSYRATFDINCDTWGRIRIPWSSFKGYGPGADSTPLDVSALRRIAIVAIGKQMDVFLALAGLRFYEAASS